MPKKVTKEKVSKEAESAINFVAGTTTIEDLCESIGFDYYPGVSTMNDLCEFVECTPCESVEEFITKNA